MDTDQQTTLAQQNDTDLGARIVKDIAEIERDYRLAQGPLSDRFMTDLRSSMRDAAPAEWDVMPHDWTIILRAPGWKPNRGLGHGDMWIQVDEISSDEVDRTWLSVATGGDGDSQLGLELIFRNALKGPAVSITNEKIHWDRLAKIGFRKNKESGRVFAPIVIDRMRLSKGFSEADLFEALLPVREVVAIICAAQTELDALLDAVRAKDKGK